jgi:hypothetical protein
MRKHTPLHFNYMRIIGKKLQIHHIDYNKKNNNLNNLISLCLSCHTKTGFNRSYWEKYFKKGVKLWKV